MLLRFVSDLYWRVWGRARLVAVHIVLPNIHHAKSLRFFVLLSVLPGWMGGHHADVALVIFISCFGIGIQQEGLWVPRERGWLLVPLGETEPADTLGHSYRGLAARPC